MLSWPSAVDVTFADFLPNVADVVRDFGPRRDSRATVLGIETEGRQLVIKHARDPEAIGWLRSAVRFHAAVSHPSIPSVVRELSTSDGFAVVEIWAPGEVLVDSFDPSVLPRESPGSPYQRFLGLTVTEVGGALQQLIHAHLATVGAGFVSVDLRDANIVYDFQRHDLSLIDLDAYRPGPFVLDVDRQFGSSTFMAPEEWQRGAVIDERTTVFTLGRLCLVLLGCARDEPPQRDAFRGSDELFAIAVGACRPEPEDRIATVSELYQRWAAAMEHAPGADPTRRAVRVLILDEEGRTLLCQHGDDSEHTWWVPPGGGVELGESPADAAARELEEELDRHDLIVGPQIGVRPGGRQGAAGSRVWQEETYFLCRTTHFELPETVTASNSEDGIRDIRWWTGAELVAKGIPTGPRSLRKLLSRIATGDLPTPDEDLGW